jgi:hypothetical protein
MAPRKPLAAACAQSFYIYAFPWLFFPIDASGGRSYGKT